jgi:3-oxoacyl-[acyl-carrier-protein] synthase-3
VIRRTLAAAGWSAADVRWVMPHNVSATSWDILLGLADLPNASLWADNIARIGHTLAGDNFINLRDACDGGAIQPGEKVLLFSYGYGAHWTGLALEA